MDTKKAKVLARDLAAQLGVSQATVSNAARRCGVGSRERAPVLRHEPVLGFTDEEVRVILADISSRAQQRKQHAETLIQAVEEQTASKAGST